MKAASATMDALKNLELLITARYPIIVIESYEGERVEQTLARVASRLGIPLWVWTVTRGLPYSCLRGMSAGAAIPIPSTERLRRTPLVNRDEAQWP